MSRKTWFTLLLIFLPFLIGALFSFLAQTFWNPVPLLVFKVDMGMVVFVTGTVVTLFLAVAYLSRRSEEGKATRKTEESLREFEQGRRRFLRRLDHEIKNPLTGLRAALVNLQETNDTEERKRAAENARRAVERLSRLLTDLRKLSDLEDRSLERLPVDMPDLMQDMVDAARAIPAYEGREINLLIARVPSPFPSVTGDRDLLALAVYNLVENALKFTSVHDSIEIRALEDGKAIVMEVADSGAGIPPEDLPKIFEELYRGTNANSTEGSGLGLALANRIVTLHGGQISVRSSQDNPRGTVFTLRLPVNQKG